MNNAELDTLMARLRGYSLVSGYAQYCHKAADAIAALRQGRDAAEANALGWERKNAHNVGKYEREADALRELLRDVAPLVWANEDVGAFSPRIDAALRRGEEKK
jgi:hypothetical protein